LLALTDCPSEFGDLSLQVVNCEPDRRIFLDSRLHCVAYEIVASLAEQSSPERSANLLGDDVLLREFRHCETQDATIMGPRYFAHCVMSVQHSPQSSPEEGAKLTLDSVECTWLLAFGLRLQLFTGL
jgi:hypothetical protein